MALLYYFAELNNYAVCGTTNRDEYLQGFFVKYGDGGVDIEPIMHLYKLQVYQIARFLDVPQEIISRAPSPDTFSLNASDEEMHYRLPIEILDPLLYAWENHIQMADICQSLSLSCEKVEQIIRDFTSKYKATRYLRETPDSSLD